MKLTTWITRQTVRTLRFLRDGLWRDASGASRAGQLGRGTVKRIVLAVRCFERERLDSMASALTYRTLFSAVPLLAVVFAVARGFGLDRYIEQSIRNELHAPEAAVDVVIGFVNSYLEHTRSGVFLGFGLLLLGWTLASLTGAIETTFNQIWQVRRPRSSFRKLTDYAAIFFMLPLLWILTGGLSIFLSTSVERLPDFVLLRPAMTLIVQLVPYVLMGILFTALYMFMPNTRVRWGSAALAGFIAGAAFQGWQFCYIHSQMWLSSYNAIYGSFAALPLFMLWCQVSWYICLYGATLSYVDQNIDYFYHGRELPGLSRRQHDFLCLLVAAFVCRRFADGRPPYDAPTLAREREIPIRLATDVLYELSSSGIVVAVASDEKDDTPAYQPATDVHQLTVGRVLDVLAQRGNAPATDEMAHYAAFWNRYEAYARGTVTGDYADTKLMDLFDEKDEKR